MNLDAATVNQWLDTFLTRLKDMFGPRLIFVANHGSWARNDGRPDSDIDAFVIIDRVDDDDLSPYRDLIHELTDGGHWVSTFFGSLAELQAWPRHQQVECWHGARTLHGNLADLVEPPRPEDYIEDMRYKAAENLHLARHYLLHPHDLPALLFRLHYPYKECFYALQSYMLLTTDTYYGRRDDMLPHLDHPDDRAVVEVSRDWHKSESDRQERPEYYFQLLERWSRNMLTRIT